jgi:predicted AlkP superfamily phosphohydrolase/phosphomutase
VLRDAGLLAEEQGRPDLLRTSAVFLYSHSGGIYLNAEGYRQGVVAARNRSIVKQAVTRALLSARDPLDGTPLVRAVIDPDVDGEALGIGGALAPDLYFDPMPGYETPAAFGASAIAAAGPPTGTGAHGPLPTRRRLHAIFFAAGPGVTPGSRPGYVRAVDVAPTVARLLGIPPPPQSAGTPILD